MNTVADHIDRALGGSIRSLARLITLIESRPAAAREIVSVIYPRGGRAHIVGVTGPPGAGKSTLVTAIAARLREKEQTVAILAVDPTSPFTGGALLGDRVRMQPLTGDRGVFIRSMASRGQLGGVAAATGAVVQLLDAVGFDVVIVETVGAGQAEVDIAANVHTTIVIEAPGMGDEVQSIKAGILEIADILVVNKADRPGANRTANALKMMVELGRSTQHGHHGPAVANDVKNETEPRPGWEIPVLKTDAVNGVGVDELVTALIAHQSYLRTSGERLAREKRRSHSELETLLRERLITRLRTSLSVNQEDQLVEAVARREIDIYRAADLLLTEKDKNRV